MTKTYAQQIGEFIATDHKLDRDTEKWMRLLHLDYAAITVGGLDRESALAISNAIPLSDERSENQKSQVVAASEKFATAENAALINGTIAHGLELDDTFEEGSLHPGVVVFPALFAVSDELGSTYEQLLVAAAVGYEVMCRVSVLVGAKESYGRGFHPTGIAGSVGAAAAVASLLGLDAEKSTYAVSIGANLAAGSLEFLSDGSWTKRLNAGQAASNGIRAGRLAKVGFEAPVTAFEGTNGFLYQYGQSEQEGRRLELEFGTAALDTSIKFYPCCRYMHGNIDLLRDIRAEYPDLSIDEVKNIDAAVIKAGSRLVSEPKERKLVVNTPVDAQFNMPFGAALALATGEATVADFDNAPEIANSLADLMAKVNCYTDDEIEAAYPAQWQARVKVEINDGTVIERFEEAYVGSAAKRATWEQIVNKASTLVGEEKANELSEFVSGLELADHAKMAGNPVSVAAQ